jgi:hypothetical protein
VENSLLGEAYAAFEKIMWGLTAYVTTDDEEHDEFKREDLPTPTLADIGALWVLGDILALDVEQLQAGGHELADLTRRVDAARSERGAEAAEAARVEREAQARDRAALA